MSNVADSDEDKNLRDFDKSDFLDLAAHAAEIQSVVLDRADAHDDEKLYLAARSLKTLNRRLGNLESQV